MEKFKYFLVLLLAAFVIGCEPEEVDGIPINALGKPCIKYVHINANQSHVFVNAGTYAESRILDMVEIERDPIHSYNVYTNIPGAADIVSIIVTDEYGCILFMDSIDKNTFSNVLGIKTLGRTWDR